MFKKSNRVKKQFFPHILKKGRVYYSENFTLRILQPYSKEEGAISFVVSKKTERSAAKRNSLRRRGYHAVKALLEKPESFKGIFFIKKGAKSLSFPKIKDELKDLLLSARILK